MNDIIVGVKVRLILSSSL